MKRFKFVLVVTMVIFVVASLVSTTVSSQQKKAPSSKGGKNAQVFPALYLSIFPALAAWRLLLLGANGCGYQRGNDENHHRYNENEFETLHKYPSSCLRSNM